jgi:nicotinamide-nucleotide amidase
MHDDFSSAILMLAKDCGAALLSRQLKVTCAESCTGGMISAAITSVAGSSDWFDRGFVTYSNGAKTDLLGVPNKLIKSHGAVSESVAAAMVEGALLASGASLAVAVTGIAGPTGGTPDKPVGTVCFAWGSQGGWRRVSTQHLDGDRHAVRSRSVLVALEGLLEAASLAESA